MRKKVSVIVPDPTLCACKIEKELHKCLDEHIGEVVDVYFDATHWNINSASVSHKVDCRCNMTNTSTSSVSSWLTSSWSSKNPLTVYISFGTLVRSSTGWKRVRSYTSKRNANGITVRFKPYNKAEKCAAAGSFSITEPIISWAAFSIRSDKGVGNPNSKVCLKANIMLTTFYYGTPRAKRYLVDVDANAGTLSYKGKPIVASNIAQVLAALGT